MKSSPKYPKTYARRNLLHCKAVGALAAAQASLAKLPKRTPKWLRRSLESIVERARPVADEMAKHRDEAW